MSCRIARYLEAKLNEKGKQLLLVGPSESEDAAKLNEMAKNAPSTRHHHKSMKIILSGDILKQVIILYWFLLEIVMLLLKWKIDFRHVKLLSLF